MIIDRRSAHKVHSLNTDVDHPREVVFMAIRHGDAGKRLAVLEFNYANVKLMEEYFTRIRQLFDHARNIAREREESRVISSPQP